MSGQNGLRLRALFGDDMLVGDGRRNKLLRLARRDRALLSWITRGSYAWFKIQGDLKAVQREMARLRAVGGHD